MQPTFETCVKLRALGFTNFSSSDVYWRNDKGEIRNTTRDWFEENSSSNEEIVGYIPEVQDLLDALPFSFKFNHKRFDFVLEKDDNNHYFVSYVMRGASMFEDNVIAPPTEDVELGSTNLCQILAELWIYLKEKQYVVMK